MKKTIYILCGLLCLIGLANCVDPLEIEIEDEVRLMVVEGLITDKEGPYEVKLKWSNPVDNDTFQPIMGAKVIILEENGVSAALTEKSEGVYQTDSLAIRGKVGNRYRVNIELINGKTYESDWGLLKDSPPIDSVHFNPEVRNTVNGWLRGVDILVDTHDPTENSQFYRWDYVETWRYQAPYTPGFEYLGNNNYNIIPKDKEVCYMTVYSSEINTATSLNNGSDIITDQLVKYVTTETNRLLRRYSILVKQYVLEEEEYLFWKSLEESVENVGGLYDRQPESIKGNVKNIDDPNEPVLGYFSVSGISEERIFISPVDLPFSAGTDSLYEACTLYLDSIPVGLDSDRLIFKAINEGKVFYSFYGTIFIEGYKITTVPCSDCTYFGGTTVKPEYWTE